MEELEERDPDEYLEEEFGSIEEETLYKKLYKKMTNDIEMKMGKSRSIGEKVDKMKFKGLVSEYKSFKKNRVHHFGLDSASNKTAFGELQICQRLYYFHFAGEEFDSTLHLVQIYFDTATFDNIERDQKIKTEAQLSLIGGTMGLLTGFSIISGIEIIFFLFRLI